MKKQAKGKVIGHHQRLRAEMRDLRQWIEDSPYAWNWLAHEAGVSRQLFYKARDLGEDWNPSLQSLFKLLDCRDRIEAAEKKGNMG